MPASSQPALIRLADAAADRAIDAYQLSSAADTRRTHATMMRAISRLRNLLASYEAEVQQ